MYTQIKFTTFSSDACVTCKSAQQPNEKYNNNNNTGKKTEQGKLTMQLKTVELANPSLCIIQY